MNTYIVLLKTEGGVTYALNIKAINFGEAEKQALVFPTLKSIIQITISNP